MGKCDICGREQRKVGDRKEYGYGMQFILEMNDDIFPRITKQAIFHWDLCNECDLSMQAQQELFGEINDILIKNEKLRKK